MKVLGIELTLPKKQDIPAAAVLITMLVIIAYALAILGILRPVNAVTFVTAGSAGVLSSVCGVPKLDGWRGAVIVAVFSVVASLIGLAVYWFLIAGFV